MTHPSVHHRAIETVIAITAALTNMRLYPPTSAIVKQAIDKVHPSIREMTAQAGALVFAESEKSLLIAGAPIGEKEEKRPQITAFLQLMLSFGIKSITFQAGVTREEILNLLALLSEKPEAVDEKGGLRRLMEKSGITRILLDQKVFVAVTQKEGIVQGTEIKQEDIVRFLAGGKAETVLDAGQVADLAKAPDRISGAFTSSLKALSAEKKEMSRRRLSRTLGNMLHSIDDLSAQAGDDHLINSAADDISKLDGETLCTVVGDNLETVTHSGLFDRMVDRLNDDQFKRLAARLQMIREKHAAPGAAGSPPAADAVQRALHRLMASEKADRLQSGIQERYELETARKKNLAVKLKAGLGSIMKGEKYCFMDDQVMQSIPDTVASLHEKGKASVAEAIVERLFDGLGEDDPDVSDAAFRTLSIIHRDILALPDRVRDALERFAKERETIGAPPGGTSDISLEAHASRVAEWVGQADTDAAVGYLFDWIVRYAREKNFAMAESLRDHLMEIDPMALTQIVKSGEIIDAEKSEGIADDFKETWTRLNALLTPDETNTLYYAFQAVTAEADHTLFTQGQFNSRLYFINRGQLRLSCRQGDREMLLATLQEGDIAGADTFFNTTVCTTSLTALTAVQLNVLERETVDQWQEAAPGLAAKINDYCTERGLDADLLKQKGLDRRSHKRMALSGAAAVQILGRNDAPTGKPFTGRLSDISAGGLSFEIRTAKSDIARLLLGRRIALSFSPGGGGSGQPVKQSGRVIGVKYLLEKEYSVHVRFDRLMAPHLLEGLEG